MVLASRQVSLEIVLWNNVCFYCQYQASMLEKITQPTANYPVSNPSLSWHFIIVAVNLTK